ncbi:MAG: hypothetical protein NZ789_02545, partial [Pseudomonadales bacterium]|nr:hypothetical protein [Pseudomonadales bacterium]
ATTAELAAAADKSATYSGGMIGSVVHSGSNFEQQGSFDAQVQFGLTHYQVKAFNAQFDGAKFQGSAAKARNDVPFKVTGTAGYETRNDSHLKHLKANGYFFGHANTSGQPPPDIGGNFQISGNNYQAGGVFAGTED